MALPGFTHTFGFTWSHGSQTLSGNVSATADNQRYIDQTVAGTTGSPTVVPISGTMLLAGVISFYAVATQTVTLTFHTATDTNKTVITLTGGVPFGWVAAADPVTTSFVAKDITSVSISNAGTAASDVKLRFLIDATVITTHTDS